MVFLQALVFCLQDIGGITSRQRATVGFDISTTSQYQILVYPHNIPPKTLNLTLSPIRSLFIVYIVSTLSKPKIHTRQRATLGCGFMARLKEQIRRYEASPRGWGEGCLGGGCQGSGFEVV